MRPHRGASAALKAPAAGLRPRLEPKGGRQGWHSNGTQCEGNDRGPPHTLLPSQCGMHIRFGGRPLADGLCPDGCDRPLLSHELTTEGIDFSAPLEAQLVDAGPEHGFIRPCPARSPAGMSSGFRLGGRGHAFRPRRYLAFDPFEMRPGLSVCCFHPRDHDCSARDIHAALPVSGAGTVTSCSSASG